MKESNVFNIFAEETPVKVSAERDRRYFRRQRERKISERSDQAHQANIEVMALGQLSKTSPFSRMKCSRNIKRAPKGRRNLAVQVKKFQEAA